MTSWEEFIPATASASVEKITSSKQMFVRERERLVLERIGEL